MIKIKKLMVSLLIALPAIVFFSGCKKFLDRKPLSATVDDLQVGALDGQVLGLYGAIRNSKSEPFCGDGFQNIPWVAMNGFRSDDAEIVADPGASAWHQTYDNFQYTKDDWGAGMYWNKHYQFIGLCNDALDLAKKGNYTDPKSIVNIAEARFFRAYAYFDMVRTFGRIPKIDFKINTPSDALVEKAQIAEIYALIDEDLTFAEQNLPLQWESKFIGRLTTGAAKTLHAKALIYRQQWGAALTLLNQVIASGQYQLYTPYWKIFKKEGELSTESIFEIQASKTAGDGDIYWSRLGQCQGIRGGSGSWDLGWGWNTPTSSLVSAYEPGDPRKDATILFSNQSDGPNSGGYGLTLPNLTNALYWNKKVYNNFNDYLAAGLGTPNNEAQNTWVNHRVLRYADALLLAAEAANETGNGALAASLLEQVRARARNGNNAVLPVINFVNLAQMRDAIKKERRIEFALEYERFFDLVRWGDAATVLGPNGYQDRNKYYPIPTAVLQANPRLVQNPDYP
jgi:hypothetical protein